MPFKAPKAPNIPALIVKHLRDADGPLEWGILLLRLHAQPPAAGLVMAQLVAAGFVIENASDESFQYHLVDKSTWHKLLPVVIADKLAATGIVSSIDAPAEFAAPPFAGFSHARLREIVANIKVCNLFLFHFRVVVDISAANEQVSWRGGRLLETVRPHLSRY
jgi:hypothetical protein